MRPNGVRLICTSRGLVVIRLVWLRLSVVRCFGVVVLTIRFVPVVRIWYDAVFLGVSSRSGMICLLVLYY